jgi:bifunctional non-homologous end joining protein LigD
VDHAAQSEPAAVFAFDVLSLRGEDLRKLPLLRRKEALQKALSAAPRVRAVQYMGERGQCLYDAACGLQLEGIVAKRADAPYRAGPSKDWIKMRTPHERHVQARSGSADVRG